MDRRDHRRARLARHGARRGPVLPVGSTRTRTRRPSRRCGAAAPSTPAGAPGRRSTSARRQRAAAGDPTPGYDGHCRDLGLPRGRGPGPAVPHARRGRGAGASTSCAARWSSRSGRSRTSSVVKGNGKPLFVLANAVDDRTMAITHVIRGEDQLPTTPRQIMLWGALERRRGAGPGRCPPTPTCPCWSTSGARSSRSGGTRWRWRCTGSRATCPRPSATTWPCSAGARATRRSCRVETLIERFRARGRAALAGLLRHQEALAHRRRVHPGAARWTSSSRPPVPGSTRCRASGRRGAGATPTRVRRPPSRRRGRPSASTPRSSPQLAAVTQERVAVLGEVPELVDFLFLEDPPDDDDAGRRRSPATSWRPGSWPTRWRPTRRARGTRTRCTR